ncbi:alpha/beta fold hydrolase [Massilia consociata]|uniref:Alpha/beta fold hydrolase n=1 Tax=Massilia consociata TaxID=760117 RepID=A0ABV6FE86_9BURK
MKAAVLITLALGAALPALPAMSAMSAMSAPVTPSAQAAGPAPAANRFAMRIAPAERFEVDGMLVERHGQGGRPLVLVPGLASGPWVWQDLVRRFSGERAVYVVTLPGFDGRPAPLGAAADSPLASARAALRELVTSRRLAKPVLVGHSLGGALALAVAQDLPALVGGVISVDGLPVFPGTEDLAPEQRPMMAAAVRQRVDAAAPDAYANQQQQYMRTQGLVDMGKAADLAALALRSDRTAVGAYMADLLAADLRPGLPKITAPVLVLVPYFAPDAGQDGITAPMKLDHYRSLLEGTPRLELAPVMNARHFAMIDQPDAVAGAVRQFLDRL